MANILLGLLLSVLVAHGHSWRHFHNGRAQGGNVPPPPTNLTEDAFLRSTRWFTQKLDHFDVDNAKTWQQKYYVDDSNMKEGKRNVAFLLISGEGSAQLGWMYTGSWADYAEQYGAIYFQVEHRFYGRSRPTEDLSVENLKYLTSDQALADLAFFVEAMTKQYNLDPDVKWISLGGSYAGSLSAWMRQKYPHLIYAAISSSGPLKAVPNFDDYFKVVADDLRYVSDQCHDAVGAATAQVEDLLKDKEGQRSLTSLFNLCDPLEEHADNQQQVANFFATLADNFAGIAQYNNYESSFSLLSVCEIMTNRSEPQEIKRLANLNKRILDKNYEVCTNWRYDLMIEELKNDSWTGRAAIGTRQWTFQTCNEFGFYQTSDKKPQIFGDKFDLDFFIQQCVDAFGPQFNSSYVDYATERVNTIYGALKIDVSRVMFVHGSVDPWHALGVTSSTNPEAPAFYVEGSSHCADMYSASSDESPAMAAARQKIGGVLQSWLNS